jgi:hypothetical protein
MTLYHQPLQLQQSTLVHMLTRDEGFGVAYAKLTNCSNNVNQGGTYDVGASGTLCILGFLHILTNDSTSIMLEHCATTMKVKMLTLHPNYVFCQCLLSLRSSM